VSVIIRLANAANTAIFSTLETLTSGAGAIGLLTDRLAVLRAFGAAQWIPRLCRRRVAGHSEAVRFGDG
jgi:hypothetical protein